MYEEDRALVARMRAGDQRAFDEFVNSSAPRLTAFVARRSALDAASLEDVVQSALIKAVRNLASYRGEAALFTWLTEICRHELIDVQRKAARRPAQLSLDESAATRLAVAELRVPENQEPAATLEAATRGAAVMQVLASLPERYFRALEAKYGDGLSVDEIARELGLTMIATQSLLARAREAFRARWLEIADQTHTGASPL